MEKVAFSPKEFAALFNKEQSWGYRQIYAGKVKTITEYGRILIPAAEVEKILGTAERYEGKKAKPRTKKEFERLKPKLQDAWTKHINSRRQAKTDAKGKPAARNESRRAVLKRLSRG